MSALNFAFVDQVLPRSNARLRTLLIDIGRKKPTFELREQVINEVPPSRISSGRAGSTPAPAGCKDVTIYDVGERRSRRIIYADSGLMAYAEGQTDLSLRLFDGEHPPVPPRRAPRRSSSPTIKVNDIRVKNVFDELERNTSEAVRGDREMSTCEMLDRDPGMPSGSGRRRPRDRRGAAADRPPRSCWPCPSYPRRNRRAGSRPSRATAAGSSRSRS